MLVWGVSGVDNTHKLDDGHGRPLYDTRFDATDLDAQKAMLVVCDDLADSDDVRHETLLCPWQSIKRFALNLKGLKTFPIPSEDFMQVITLWLSANSKYKAYVGLSKAKDKVLFVSATFTTYTRALGNGFKLEPTYEKWQEYADDVNADSPSNAQLFQTTNQWLRMETELAFIRGTIRSVLISSGCIALTIMLFTGNLLIMLYTLILIISVVTSLIGYYVLWDWQLGAVESLSVSIVMGLAIDYVLHVGHAYVTSEGTTRFEKTKHAMIRIGPSVVAASITTVASMVVLFFCELYLFNQIGIIVAATLTTGVVFCFFGFIPMVMIAGPLRKRCDMYYGIRVCFDKLFKREQYTVVDAHTETYIDMKPLSSRRGSGGARNMNDALLEEPERTSANFNTGTLSLNTININTINIEQDEVDYIAPNTFR